MDISDTFTALDKTRIEQFVTESQEEHLLLDFKTVNKADLSDSSDRKSLAVALSGFANASGGLIVWGVDARKKGPEQPDVACGIKGIDDLALFLSRLNEFTAMFVRPAVEGVMHRAIQTSKNRGFVVSLIPESSAGPHMAMAGVGKYYKRSGSSFLPMEHFEIADMFGRRRRPKLRLAVELRDGGAMPTGDGQTEHYGKFLLLLSNDGRGTAKNLYVGIQVDPPYGIGVWGIDGNRTEGLPRIAPFTKTSVKFGGASETVLHPGLNLELASISVFTPNNPGPLPDLTVKAQLAADEVGVEGQTIVVQVDQFRHLIRPR
jgi:hypothetical protein